MSGSISDFAGNQYTLIEYEPIGYAIYSNDTGIVVEYSAGSLSPYLEYSGSLYYAGPTQYYVYNPQTALYEHTILEESLSSNTISIMYQAAVKSHNELMQKKEIELLEYIDSGIISNDNIIVPYGGNVPYDQDKNTYVKDSEYIFDLETAQQIGYYDTEDKDGDGEPDGYCAYVASGMLLLYYQLRDDINLIPDEYINSERSGFKYGGRNSTSSFVYKELLPIGMDDLGYGHELDGVETGNLVENYLDSIGYDNSDVQRTNVAIGQAAIRSLIDNDTPVIYGNNYDSPRKPGTPTRGHSTIAYGYTEADELIMHFGWAGYNHVVTTYIIPWIPNICYINTIG